MKIETKITQMLGIDLPIVGAPMFLVSYPDLVAAVSNAGGLGAFPSLNYRTVDALRDGLAEIKEKTDKPIGVNLILYKDHNPDWPKQLEACLDAKVDLIITSLGTPKSVVGECKSVGTKVWCDVTTLRHAEIVAKAGADAVVAVAQGAGGHAGNISPFSLIPYLKDAIDIPVLAAGSIGTGGQMAAAMALGADGVYVGTRFINSNEAQADNKYKQMIIDSKPEEIVYTEKISGIPANWLKKSIEHLDLEKDNPTSLTEDKQWKDIWSAGHGIAQIHDIKPAGDIVKEMAQGYLDTIKNLPTSAGQLAGA